MTDRLMDIDLRNCQTSQFDLTPVDNFDDDYDDHRSG